MRFTVSAECLKEYRILTGLYQYNRFIRSIESHIKCAKKDCECPNHAADNIGKVILSE